VIGYVLVAILNGIVIGTSRAINGQLSAARGAFPASLWNHVVGFVFLTLVLAVIGEWRIEAALALPWFAYLGGLFGALFVAVTSYVFPRLGAMNAAVLVISGQMISAVVLDYLNEGVTPTVARCAGVVLVLVGLYLTRIATRSPAPKDKAAS
jgi:transporter family-2 protein